MEVLFEFGDMCCVLQLTSEGTISSIQSELSKWVDVEITLCSSSTDSNSDKNLYYLQKWSKKWNCFVIIDDSKDILDGDRLTMCKKGSTGGNEVEVSDVLVLVHIIHSSYIQIDKRFTNAFATHCLPGGQNCLTACVPSMYVNLLFECVSFRVIYYI